MNDTPSRPHDTMNTYPVELPIVDWLQPDAGYKIDPQLSWKIIAEYNAITDSIIKEAIRRHQYHRLKRPPHPVVMDPSRYMVEYRQEDQSRWLMGVCSDPGEINDPSLYAYDTATGRYWAPLVEWHEAEWNYDRSASLPLKLIMEIRHRFYVPELPESVIKEYKLG